MLGKIQKPGDKTNEKPPQKPATKNPVQHSIQRATSNPDLLSTSDVLHLQRTIGNQRTREFLERKQKPKPATSTETSRSDTLPALESSPSGGILQRKADNIPNTIPPSQNNAEQKVKEQEQTNKAHKKDREKLLEYVREGLNSQDRQIRNSCRWFKEGKASLCAATPTGDSYARVIAAGRDPKKDTAYLFSKIPIAKEDVDTAVSYNANDLTDLNNVIIGSRSGRYRPGKNAIVITCPITKELVWEFLRHEVQHSAGKFLGRDNFANARQAIEAYEKMKYDNNSPGRSKMDKALTEKKLAAQAEVELSAYKDEYCANFYSGASTDRSVDLATKIKEKGVELSARQLLAIFSTKPKELETLVTLEKSTVFEELEKKAVKFSGRQVTVLKDLEEFEKKGVKFSITEFYILQQIIISSSSYLSIEKAWDQNYVLADGKTKFREAVVAYQNPDGFNPANSPEVDNFYLVLDALGEKEATRTKTELEYGIDAAPVQTATGVMNDQVGNLINIIFNQLTPDDAAYILKSPEWMKKINKHLTGDALNKVIANLHIQAERNQN